MKIAVIGAGTLGVTTSLELISHGHEVKVFEKNAGVAQEASFATAGFIGPGLTHSWVGPGMVSHILKRYFSMQGERAIVLVEGAVPSDAIDVEAAQAKVEDARARIEQSEAGDESVNRFRAERDLEFAENLIRIAGR